MNSEVVNIVVLHGTVRDLLNIYPFADDNLKERVFDSIRGARNPDQEIRLQVTNQEEADSIARLSRLAEAPMGYLHVRSQSRPGMVHTLTYKGGIPIACSCESFTYSRNEPCRHMAEATVRKMKPIGQGED